MSSTLLKVNSSTVTFSNTTSSWFNLTSIPITVTLAPSETLSYEINLTVPYSETTGTEQDIIIKAIPDESPRMSDSVLINARIGPMAWFDAQPVFGTIPHTVFFTDLSVGQVSSWNWDFGDGVTSTDRNPTHTYIKPGVFSVGLTVVGPNGSDSYLRNMLVRINPLQLLIPILMR